ncbi:MAG TPA: class I SAM-dependent methyltransferase [Thermoplasmata archaeon]|nr:class I SAM-dependent methyltransferase [Thermoplasmata archaeon]
MALATKAEVRATYERIAEPFAASREEPWPEVLQFGSSLPEAARIADVGCGNGRHARTLASTGRSIVAVDFARNLLLIGRRGSRGRVWGAHIAWIQAEATTLPLRDGCMDAAICVAVLHHLPTVGERVRALRELRRIVASRGRVFVSVWALDQPRFRKAVDARRQLPREVQGDIEVPWTMPDGVVIPRYYHLFQEGELEQLIIESGLHGERFFRGPGNLFAEASVRG